jgi:hypothetical protein
VVKIDKNSFSTEVADAVALLDTLELELDELEPDVPDDDELLMDGVVVMTPPALL